MWSIEVENYETGEWENLGEGPFDSEETANEFGNAEVGVPWRVIKIDSKLSLYRTAQHIATGKFCSLMRYDASDDRFFCNFGAANNPFCWVPRADLTNFVL